MNLLQTDRISVLEAEISKRTHTRIGQYEAKYFVYICNPMLWLALPSGACDSTEKHCSCELAAQIDRGKSTQPGSDAEKFIYAPTKASRSNLTAIYAVFNEGNTYHR